ncbi:MAG: hypothetical protein P8Y03_31305, partial [Anaerolineales bacterium]
AAPVLATLKLLSRYTIRKMLDLDPWPETDQDMRPIEMPGSRTLEWLQEWLQSVNKMIKKKEE